MRHEISGEQIFLEEDVKGDCLFLLIKKFLIWKAIETSEDCVHGYKKNKASSVGNIEGLMTRWWNNFSYTISFIVSNLLGRYKL